ncbi:uncharacterized protein LOC105665044 [Ceratitis capitata]|uniref:uncharacterized protein LOC105665044 n=1 Tax=Ceratitis capitata TaxID=7213 RepID=UPI0006189258|nr:uncharacterized protein LOC105665044 [Ceratitis capitata]
MPQIAGGLQLIAKNAVTKRLSFRSLKDIRRFRITSSVISSRGRESVRPHPVVSFKRRVKLFAVKLAIRKAISKLVFMEDVERGKLGTFTYTDCPEKIFSWMYEDWLDTLAYRIIWLNMINRQMPLKEFTCWMKLKNLTSLRNCLLDLSNVYLYQKGWSTTMEAMESVIKFHNLENNIKVDINKRTLMNNKVKTEFNALLFLMRTLGSLTKKPEDLFLTATIENKHVLDAAKVREEMAELHIRFIEKRLEKEIQRIQKRFKEEQFATTCTTDTYFNQIANLRERIAKLTQRYDAKYAQLEGNATYLKTNIDKINANRAYLQEQLDWYKQALSSSDPPSRPTESPRLSILMKNLPLIQKSRRGISPWIKYQKSDSVTDTSAAALKRKSPRSRTRRKKDSQLSIQEKEEV